MNVADWLLFLSVGVAYGVGIAAWVGVAWNRYNG